MYREILAIPFAVKFLKVSIFSIPNSEFLRIFLTNQICLKKKETIIKQARLISIGQKFRENSKLRIWNS